MDVDRVDPLLVAHLVGSWIRRKEWEAERIGMHTIARLGEAMGGKRGKRERQRQEVSGMQFLQAAGKEI